jgi:crotonobetainyl-CoA:carnitine CoA-transferase CaiB-like acyl-CoA transferase
MLPPDVFENVRIVELAQYVFVPAAGSLLADFGAEVIKIEMMGSGDPYRTLSIGDGREFAEVNIALEQNNRNKKSIAVDAKSPEGKAVLKRLIESADVFISSLRPQALGRLGLDVDTLRSWNPKIIYVRGNGFGFKGAEANRPGYDGTAFWTRGGFADVLMHVDHHRPVRSRPAFGDHMGSIGIAYGIAAALFRRERTGKPSVVEASLLGTGMWVLSQDITAAQTEGYDGKSVERRAPSQPLFQAYQTKDGRWVQLMLMNPDRYWANLCRTLEMDELINDARFKTVDKRAKHGVECGHIIKDAFASKTWKEWKPRFDQFDAPWELVTTIEELLEDDQAISNGYIVNTPMSNGSIYKLVSGPVSFDGYVPTEYRRAPKLGEDTDALLESLGYNDKEMESLRQSGAVQ